MDKIIGKNPVLEALRAGSPLNKIMVAKGLQNKFVQEILTLAKEQNILLQFVDKKQLDFLAQGENHQGIVAQGAAKKYVEWEEIYDIVVKQGKIPLFLLLDGIVDPRNLGAILRTADAAGVDCVIIPKHRAAPLTSTVSKSSAGAVEYVPVSRVTNLVNVMEALKKKGCWVVGAESTGFETFYKADLKGPLAVVIGSEGKGIGKRVKEECDFLIKIPMKGQVNSLNVSVAASIILYEIVRQRDYHA